MGSLYKEMEWLIKTQKYIILFCICSTFFYKVLGDIVSLLLFSIFQGKQGPKNITNQVYYTRII